MKLLLDSGRGFDYLTVLAESGAWHSLDRGVRERYLAEVPDLVIPLDQQREFGRDVILACLQRPDSPFRAPRPHFKDWLGVCKHGSLQVEYRMSRGKLSVSAQRIVDCEYHRASLSEGTPP